VQVELRRQVADTLGRQIEFEQLDGDQMLAPRIVRGWAAMRTNPLTNEH